MNRQIDIFVALYSQVDNIVNMVKFNKIHQFIRNTIYASNIIILTLEVITFHIWAYKYEINSSIVKHVCEYVFT